MSDSLFCYKKRAIRSKIFVFFNMFLTVFTAFPLFMPKSASLPSLFAPSLFLKSDRSYSLLSLYKRVTVNKSLPPLYTKERPWTICSHGSLQKCDDSDLLFSKSNWLFPHFTYKKQAIRLKTKERIPNPANLWTTHNFNTSYWQFQKTYIFVAWLTFWRWSNISMIYKSTKKKMKFLQNLQCGWWKKRLQKEKLEADDL